MRVAIFNRSGLWFKIICLAVALLFSINTISWAYPDTIRTMSDTLSGQSVFQPAMFSPDAEVFKDSIFSEADTLTTTLSAAQYLLGDPEKKLGRMPLEHLERVVGGALSKAGLKCDNIDLGHIYYHPETSKIVLIPYTTGRDRHVIQIARKDDVSEKKLSGYEWVISDNYVVKVLSEKEIPAPRKKVLLIASPLISFDIGQKEKRSGYFTKPPLGFYKIKKDLTSKELAYVDVFDPNLHPEKASELLADMIRSEGYDIVSIALMHENTKDVIGWIDNIKRIAEESGQKTPIVLGGAQEGTHNYKKWFRFSQIDGIVLGYGELPLSHIIYNLNHGKAPFNMVPGVAYENEDEEVIVQPAEDFDDEDFREFTFSNDPAEYIPYEDYWEHNGRVFSPANYKARGATLEAVEFSTSSHCRNKCGFCSRCTVFDAATKIANRPVLFLSAQEMFELLVKYINYHNPKAVFMREDDLINDRTQGRDRAIKFFELVKQARYEGMIPFDFKIYLQTKTKTLVSRAPTGEYYPDMELINAMADGGVYLTAMGVESFSDRLLKAPSINKKATAQMHWVAIDGLKRAGIIPLVNVQLFPPEITVYDFLINAEGVMHHVKLGGQISVLPTLDYLPGAAIAHKADTGEYETIGYDLVDKRTGDEIYHPVTFVPGDALMKKAFLEREEKQAEIEQELKSNPRYSRFTYPPQPVVGLIRIAAVYRSLNMEDKVQEVYQLIFKLLAKAERSSDEWTYPRLIGTNRAIAHQEAKARLFMSSEDMSLSKASDLCVIMESVIFGDVILRGQIYAYLQKFLDLAPDSDGNRPIKNRIWSSLRRSEMLYEKEEQQRGYGISEELGTIELAEETSDKVLVTGKIGIKRIFAILAMLLLSAPFQLMGSEKNIEAPWSDMSAFGVFAAGFMIVAMILAVSEAYNSLKEVFKDKKNETKGKKGRRGSILTGSMVVIAMTSFVPAALIIAAPAFVWSKAFPLQGMFAIFVIVSYLAFKNLRTHFLAFARLDTFSDRVEAASSEKPHVRFEVLVNKLYQVNAPWKYKYGVLKQLAFDALSTADVSIIENIESKIKTYGDQTGFLSMALAYTTGSPVALAGIQKIAHNFELTKAQRIEVFSYMAKIKHSNADLLLVDALKNDPYYEIREAIYELLLERERTGIVSFATSEQRALAIAEIEGLRPTLKETLKSSFLTFFSGGYLKHKIYVAAWAGFSAEAFLWGSSNLPLAIIAAGAMGMLVFPAIIIGASFITGLLAYAMRAENHQAAPSIETIKEKKVEKVDKRAQREESLPIEDPGIKEAGKMSYEGMELFEIFEKEANSRRRRCTEAANRLNNKYYKNKHKGIMPTVILDKMPTVEAKNSIDKILSKILGDEDVLFSLDENEKRYLEILESEAKYIEVDAVIASLISLAVKASYEKKDFVLAVETDWIEGYLQKDAVEVLIREVGRLEKTLKKAGLKNIHILLKEDNEDLEAWSERIKLCADSDSDLSGVLIFGGQKSIEYFDKVVMKDLTPSSRAFLAGVETMDLDLAYESFGEDFERQLNCRFIEMLAISLEVAIGKADPKIIQNSGIKVSLDKEKKILWMMPKAEPVEYDLLKDEYDRHLMALRAA